jgi:hypothetical protein
VAGSPTSSAASTGTSPQGTNLGRDAGLTMESLASGVLDPAFGEDETRRGEAAQQSSAGEFAAACCDVKRV